MPSLILLRISARFEGEDMGSHYSFAIRISQFECAILLDFMKWQTKFRLRWREIQMIGRGLVSTNHVLLAAHYSDSPLQPRVCVLQRIDDFSPPIPTEKMIRRIDRLADLKTAIVTISGGEPLMHPEIEKIIRRIRNHGMIAGIITNGYLLTPKKSRR